MPAITTQPSFLAAMRRPALLILLVAICFGLPLNTWPAFLGLSIAAVASLVGVITTASRRWAIAVVVAALSVTVRVALPVHHIDEGHSVFSSGLQGPLAAALPADVFAAMRNLEESLPKRFDQKPPARAWAFSADSIWRSSPLSRVREEIDFDDRWALRIGTMNDNVYNDRRAELYLPLVFRFDLPETSLGGRLCWTGTLYWPREEGGYEEVTSAAGPVCREIAGQFAPPDGDGRPVFTVYAADFERERPLAIRLDGTGIRDYTPLIRALVSIAAVVAVLVLLVRLRMAAVTAWGLAVLSIVAYMAQRSWRGEPPAYSGLPFMGRGNDGLTYYSAGRAVLERMAEGDWHEALRGGVDVFYFAPGMRYAWAGLTTLFGETFFGYFIIVTIIPFIVLYFLRAVAGRKTAILLFWCFLLVPIFEALGFLHWYYVKLAVRGFGGSLAWCALFAGVLIMMRRLYLRDMCRGGFLAAGLLLALAISLRPNVAPGILVLVAGAALLLLRDGGVPMTARLWDTAMLGLGSSAIFAITLHNWYFGGVFVPLTDAWDVEANLQFAPSNYGDAVAAILAGDPSWATKVGRVLKHIRGWVKYYEFWLLIPYATLWVALLRRDLAPFIRVLAASLLASHAVFLFYPGFPRYLYGLWLLTFVVFILVWRRVYWPAATRRWPRLAAFREPAWLRHVIRLDPVVQARAPGDHGRSEAPA